MEYHYRSVKCPNCGRTADRTTTKNNQQLWGTPFRTCPKCQTVYFDSEYKEKAIEFFNGKGGYLTAWTYIIGLIMNAGFVFMIYIVVQAMIEGSFIPQMLIGVIVFGCVSALFDYTIISHHKHNAFLKKNGFSFVDDLEGNTELKDYELSKSLERLSDRKYLDALKAHGVQIPPYFYERLEKNNLDEKSNVKVENSNPTKGINLNLGKETEKKMVESEVGKQIEDYPKKDVNNIVWKKISYALIALSAVLLAVLIFFIPYISNYSTLLKFSEVSIGESKVSTYWADPSFVYLSADHPQKTIDVYVGDDSIAPEVSCENAKVSITTSSVDHDGFMTVTLKEQSKGVAMVKFSDNNNSSTAFYVIALCH